MACCGNAAGHFLMGMPPLCKGRWPGVSRVGGIDLLQCLRRNPPPPPGTLRWGDFCSGKSHQNPPRAFHPRYLPWGTRLSMRQAGVRPVTLAVAPVSATTPSHHGNWPYDWVVSTSGPTLEEQRSRRRKPGHRSMGTAANQGKALAIEALSAREVGTFCRSSTPSM